MSEPTKEQIDIIFKKLKQNRYNKVKQRKELAYCGKGNPLTKDLWW
jgi:hypothetical protein